MPKKHSSLFETMRPTLKIGFFIYFLPILLGFSGTGLSGLGLLILLIGFGISYRRRDFQWLTDLSQHLNPTNFKRLFAFYLLWWVVLFCGDYYAFNFDGWDIGSFSNGLANMVLQGRYFNSFLQIPSLADHFTPLLLVLTPLFQLKITFAWLWLVKLIAYGVSGWLIYKISVGHIQGPVKYVPPTLWFVSELSTNLMLSTFQPNSLVPPFLLAGMFFFLKGRFWLGCAVMLPALGLKEDMALVYCVTGVYWIVYQNHWKRGLGLIGFGVFVGLSVSFWLTPWLAGQTPIHLADLGPFTHMGDKVLLLVRFFLAFGGILLFSPRAVIWASSGFAISLLGATPAFYATVHHYHTLPLSIGLVALVLILANWEKTPPTWLGPVQSPRRFAFILTFVFLFLAANQKTPQWRLRLNYYKAKVSTSEGFKLVQPSVDRAKAFEDLEWIRSHVDSTWPTIIITHVQPYLLEFSNVRLFEHGQQAVGPFAGNQPTRVFVYSSSEKMNGFVSGSHQNVIQALESDRYEIITKNGIIKAAVLR